MKKRFLALSLAVATVITVLAVGIFASDILRSADTQLTDADTGPVIVAGYTDGTNITIGKNLFGFGQMLDNAENWVLPGRLMNGTSVAGTFGAQWDGTNLYLAIQGCNALSDITLRLGDGDAEAFKASTLSTSDAKLADNIAELKVGISQFDPDAINNKSISIQISLSSGGSFSGKLKLSSVEWWKTSNNSNTITPSLYLDPTGMREYETTEDITDAVNRGDIGQEGITNGLHLWDFYNEADGVTNYMGTMTQATYSGADYTGMADRSKTIYFAFDFKAEKMPVYELGEALGSYHASTYYANFGFTWQMADAPVTFTYLDGKEEKTATYSNVSLGGIVNTEDGLYLIVAGRHFNTLKLNKEERDTFNVGLAWHSNGDLSVYIDGVEKAYYTGTTKCMRNGQHVTSQGVRFMCRRNELPRVPGDDFDLYVTNLAFGSAYPDAPVKALSFKDIQGTNTSAEAVTSELNLPTSLNTGLFQVDGITWESSNEEVVSTDGKVTRPATGAEKVTLTAKLNGVKQKSIDVVVLGEETSNANVWVVRGDKTPAVGVAAPYDATTYGDVFHFDSNNNSLVYDTEAENTKVNVIQLTDLDSVSRLNRETISIWTSNDNKTYTRVEGNYKLLHVGTDWYLYNFEAAARYIKVNFTLTDELYDADMESLETDVPMEKTYTMYDGAESDFTNVLSSIMTARYEEVFGANGDEFTKTTYTIKNNSGKKQQDHAWCIPGTYLNVDLTNLRVMLDGEYLYHYVEDGNLYVRIPDVKKDATVTLTILYGNAQALDISDKESVYEVTYGTKEIFIDENQRFMFALEAGTALRNGTTLEQDVIIRNYINYFDLSNDGGQTWRQSGSFSKLTYDGYSANGGYIFYEGRLYWRTQARVFTTDENGNSVGTYPAVVVTYSDDGGETWADPTVVDHPEINGTQISVSSYANGVATSVADDDGPNIDLIFPVGGYYLGGDFANVFLLSYDGGRSWEYAKTEDGITYLFAETERKSEGGLSEATLLENEAHELVWYCRWQTNAVNHFAISVSKDYGLTWSEPEESTVYGTNTQPTITPIDGDPLFVWGGNNAFGGHSSNRGPLSVAVSYDGLYTFRNIQNVFTETYFEDYTQTKFCAYITNPSVVKSGDDLIIAYYTNKPTYKVFTRITDYENWFYRTKGIYDSFESQNTKYEGWVPFMGGTSITNDTDYGEYALEIAPHGVVSRSVPYLQNGTVSMNVYVDDVYINGESTFTIELQSAFTPVMNRCAPISLEVRGGTLYANGVSTNLTMNQGWNNSISIDLGLAKKVPTASVTVNGDSAEINLNDIVEDYVCYIAVNTGNESIFVDDVLVQSNLDAINYSGEIKEVDVAISTHPTSQDKGVGEPATFSVEAQGYGLMYQWYVNSGNGWETIVGATSASYTTGILTDSHNGYQYKCIVMDRNENEVHSDVATLTVDYISVSIDWGTLQFICDENNDWRAAEEGADTIRITNTSDVDMYASVTYQAVDGHDAITGSFDEDEDPETASQNLAAENGTVTWTLKLSSEGEANQDLDSTPIGTVTLRIQKATNNS